VARIDLVNIAHAYESARSNEGFDGPSLGENPAQASLPSAWALRPMTMSWTDGGAYALLGPSGCGETTLLNIISWLVVPTRGQVLFDGREISSLGPQQRNIAQVFQFPVIYDTMTVFDNLAFPLRNRGWKSADVRRRVLEIAEILELTADLPRRARGLSADAKQKISLGRGLVRTDVAAVLFDEPLTVIDPHVKWLLRRKLKQIHHQLKLTLVYVTHDQTEALTFADQVVVMSSGEVVQIGTPQELFEKPAHRFVGHFIGTPGMNFLSCSWQGAARIGETLLQTSSGTAPPSGASLHLGIRPEHIELSDAPGANRLPARIESIQDHGVHRMVRLTIDSHRMWAKLRGERSMPAGESVFAFLPPSRCALYVDDQRLP
jgi:glycerol transport system ATP-binding protein